MVYYPRAEFAKVLGDNKAILDYLADIQSVRTIINTVTTTPADLTALTARVVQLEADVLRAIRDARDAQLWDFVPPTRDEILAITDIYILTEDGDPILTEGGDPLILESA